jgi:hypothetical protein
MLKESKCSSESLKEVTLARPLDPYLLYVVESNSRGLSLDDLLGSYLTREW